MIAEIVSLSGYESQYRRSWTRQSGWRWSFSSPARPKIIQSFRAEAVFRKARWSLRGKGKSEGVRVIYFFLAEPGRIYMAGIYAKSRKETLSAADRNVLAKVAAQMKKAAKGGR